MWDSLWISANVATMCGTGYGLIANGAIGCTDGYISWVGYMSELNGDPERLASSVYDTGGALITPGLIDSHTHVVYPSGRWQEFERNLEDGQCSKKRRISGGLLSSVSATRDIEEELLLKRSKARVKKLIASGVTTVESKSGYGLDKETELKLMKVSRAIERELPITVKSTFLGAHATPPEYEGHSSEYIAFLCNEVLPLAVKEELVDFVDGFCDYNGFSHQQISTLFQSANAFGLPLKLHADQYSDFGAGELAARFGAISADHLDNASVATVKALAKSGTTPVLLPGSSWMLKSEAHPPLALFRKYKIPVAIATNCNPGSSPTTSTTSIMHIACRLFGMTPKEALLGFTRAGAKALGVERTRGTIEVGKHADLAGWCVEHPAELAYHIGGLGSDFVVKGGKLIYKDHNRVRSR